MAVRNSTGDASKASRSLGVLYTGYLEKTTGQYGNKWKRRFVVLTHEAIHWFKVLDV
jgi:hypothetical protein